MKMKIDRVVMYRTYFRYGYIGTILLSNLLPQDVRVSTSKILWNLDDNRNSIYKNYHLNSHKGQQHLD